MLSLWGCWAMQPDITDQLLCKIQSAAQPDMSKISLWATFGGGVTLSTYGKRSTALGGMDQFLSTLSALLLCAGTNIAG